MILKDMEAGKHTRAMGDIKRIKDVAAKMVGLLTDLLELSSVGKVMNPSAKIDMNRLVKDVLGQLAGPIDKRQIELVVQTDLPSVIGDSRRLSAVIQNLVENAVKYMGDQAVPRIEIGTMSVGKECAYFVRDNGKGIDPNYHENIFSLFNKLDAKSEGTGVGLALVKRIIDVHGGRVWVESEGIGKGSTFCFALPNDGITRE
jgi:light-regulated signal transduction histidine kinase (bacteriophytochrome)